MRVKRLPGGGDALADGPWGGRCLYSLPGDWRDRVVRMGPLPFSTGSDPSFEVLGKGEEKEGKPKIEGSPPILSKPNEGKNL